MEFRAHRLQGIVEIIPKRIEDARGYFSETFRSDELTDHIGPTRFVQDNESLNVRAGTIRGLHFQSRPSSQGKLVRCLAGSIFDVAVDLRVDSPSYGGWLSVILSPERYNQLWVPAGFAHGFCTLEPNSILSYRVTDYYNRDHDKGVAWDDPDIAVDWPSVADPDTLSAKDRQQPRLADLPAYFSMEDR